MRSAISFVVVITVISIGGCGTDVALDQPTPPDFRKVQSNVFDQGCVSCHGADEKAANLDLSEGHACAALVNAPSCLFPRRMRVASDPDASFLMNKLTGTDLGGAPERPCMGEGDMVAADSSAMPLGGRVTPEQLALVRDWIAAGASCDPGASPVLVSATVDTTSAVTGSSIMLMVKLDRPAGHDGFVIAIDSSDPRALPIPSPAVIEVVAGEESASIELRAASADSDVRLRVLAGAVAVELHISVVGNEPTQGPSLVQVFYDAVGPDQNLEWVEIGNPSSMPIDLTHYSLGAGMTNYTYTTMPLVGVLAAHRCMRVGGPISSSANGSPVLDERQSFVPNIPNAGQVAAGVGLFAMTAGNIAPASRPIDTVVYGPTNTTLLGADGTVHATDSIGAPPGSSLVRKAGGWIVQVPTPGFCPM